MRLQVFLSHSGVCSRRKAMDVIFSGRVSVNGCVTREPSLDIDPQTAIVMLDGVSVRPPAQKLYILLNKPRGVVCTVKDAHAQKTVIDLFPPDLRKGLYPVGRLDQDTTGLLLLTNDGDFAHRLSHPSFDVEKTYEVVLNKEPSDQDIRTICNGVLLEGRKTAPCRIKKIGGSKIQVILHEGRKRQIRRVFSLFHYHVEELKRLRQGHLELGTLEEGQWRLLPPEDVEKILRGPSR